MTKYTNLIKKGLKNPRQASYFLRRSFMDKVPNLYRDPSIYFNSKRNIGKNIFQFDWDLLIILDTARIDAMRMLKDEYDFIPSVNAYWSVGGQSVEWMTNTFTQQYADVIQDTAYISGNPHSKTVFENGLRQHWDSIRHSKDVKSMKKYGKDNFVRENTFDRLEQPWKYNEESDYRYCPPRPITDRAITVDRKYDFDKIILHYMPPHTPYRDEAIPDGSEMDSDGAHGIMYLRKGGSRNTVFTAYLNMLRWVLDDVKLLLDNIDRKNVILTADHGEAFGEYGIYKHHAGSLHPHVRQVPIVETTANDNGEYSPSFELESSSQNTVEKSLKALGYISE